MCLTRKSPVVCCMCEEVNVDGSLIWLSEYFPDFICERDYTGRINDVALTMVTSKWTTGSLLSGEGTQYCFGGSLPGQFNNHSQLLHDASVICCYGLSLYHCNHPSEFYLFDRLVCGQLRRLQTGSVNPLQYQIICAEQLVSDWLETTSSSLHYCYWRPV